MTGEFERTLSLFEAACELTDPARRRAFLKSACSGDPGLQEEIEKLASAGQQADEFFAECIPTPAAISAALESSGMTLPANAGGNDEDRMLGSRVGVYELVQKIGEGGCGVVYMADQVSPVRRRVALKVIKLGMDTRSVIARFEAERQALAMMDHPNIARVFDAGATDKGRPYFVMELVNGVRITEYCDERQLGVEQRLDLFILICHAVQHAHQKGIIHRDIKPSNILVTIHDGVPVPKVIDFGIAKATEESLTDKTLFTAYSQLIGTPAYMSPEQVELSGMDLDTRSDIYSLGVLLYELLTGRTPFDTRDLLKSGVDEMRRTLRERDPCSPSAKLNTLGRDDLTRTAVQRRVEAPRLLTQLRGDLDWIVMKALEKDRTRRYETADALATDVRRYLDHEPILARPPNRWYQLQKLVRRNRIVVASAAAVAGALLVGTIISTRLFLKERAAEQKQAVMRQEAEARERLTQAALLAAEGNYPDAEKLLPGIDLNKPKPSLELAPMLRSLGDWHALIHQWPQAADRFAALANIDVPDSIEPLTIDYTRWAVALFESSDPDAYKRFCQSTIIRFRSMNAPQVERIIEISLFLPASQPMLNALQAPAQAAAGWYDRLEHSTRPQTRRAGWIALSLALFEYRQADYGQAVERCQQCLDIPRLNPAGIASAQMILAMSCWRMNQKPLALSHWSTGDGTIEAKFKKGVTAGDSGTGYWYDWEIARILSLECQNLFAQAGSAAPGAPPLKPSVNTAGTFRALGEWHALRNEWLQAADCFGSALKLDQFDGWKDTSNDQLSRAAMLVEAGDTAGYERFRQEEIARFKPADSIMVADFILKSSLLEPADANFLASLAPVAQVAASPFQGKWPSDLLEYYDGWRSVSLGLLEFRRGNYAKAVDWSRHCLGCTHDIRARTATARVILAMSLHKLGQDDEASSELIQARNVIEAKFSSPLDHGVADQGMWFEWVAGRILLREATACLAGTAGHAIPVTAMGPFPHP